MKKFKFLLIPILFCLVSTISFAQEEEIIEAEKPETVETKKIKVDIASIPLPILKALQKSYAKHFVMKAYKTKGDELVYLVELQKNRKWFTVAINDNGRVIKEIQEKTSINNNAVAVTN